MNFSDVRPGQIVKHYKSLGGHYEVIAIGRDSEDRSRRVITYRSIRTGETWTRPAAPTDKRRPDEDAFCEMVEYNGQMIERFADTGINVYEEVKADVYGRLVVHTAPGTTAYIRHHYEETGQALLIQQPRLEITGKFSRGDTQHQHQAVQQAERVTNEV